MVREVLSGKRININPRFGNNFLDNNALEDALVEKILQLSSDDEHGFTMLLPYSVKDEIARPNTPAAVKRRAGALLFSEPVSLTPNEVATHHRIRILIQGNAKAGKHDSDAFHLVESQKYGGRHFLTNDSGMLKKKLEIWQELQIWVLTPTEFIADYFPHAEA